MYKASWFQRYLLPGFVFQSVVIAGGYGTGRELVEFFLSLGPISGLLAMAIATLIWSVVCASSFEFARTFRAFDYRRFFVELLGRGWVLYELGYIALLMIILAVIAAAAGTILEELFGFRRSIGVVGMMVAVGVLVFRGSRAIERFMAAWSFVLYGVYVVFFVWSLMRFGDNIGSALERDAVQPGWLIGGVKYAGYNLAIIPAVLFAVRHGRDRRDVVTSGLLVGPIAMLPALLFYVAMVSQHPGILERPVPANALLEALGSRTFQLVFQLILFGTLIETGAGLLHAVNERVGGAFADANRVMPDYLRPTIATVLLLAGALVAQFGLIELIASGYGTLTWLFLAVFVVPILTVGVWKIRQASS